ncbi:endopeptidase La [Candidatus Poribacteria bacterium]|nr:endopeptidase La [Candidatus Poribacteria bacterium]
MELDHTTSLESDEESQDYPSELPLIAMYGGAVIFPFMPPTPPFMPPYLVFQGPRAVAAVEAAMVNDPRLAILVQLNAAPEPRELTTDDMRHVGTLISIAKYKKEGDSAFVLVQGRSRVRIAGIVQQQPFLKVAVEYLQDEPSEGVEIEAAVRAVRSQFRRIAQLSPRLQEEVADLADNLEDPGPLADFVAAIADLKTEQRQSILEALNVGERLNALTTMLAHELNVAELGAKIQSQAQEELTKDQREYMLRQQLKQIQKELGEAEDPAVEIEELREKLAEANLPEQAHKAATRELDRLSKMPPAAAEYTVSRTYLETLLALPWNQSTEDHLDIQAAAAVLDEDHYGLEKVKDRVLEYLAVRKLKADMRGPILCFVGPPGVGKTSLGRSIARSLGRKFIRMSLGGVRDEAEIRGHRRTYIGALPGRVIQNLRTVESSNPVFMLDEVDKLGSDFRGDPSSALLEVLDPEQNHSFSDHYLDVPFDLSKTMFIATANVLDPIPPPLRDRMEVIEIPGYTTEEKVSIARKYLVPKQMDAHGITAEHMTIDDDALYRIIKEYTREAGVRNLERELGTLARKIARVIAEGSAETANVTAETIPTYLGPTRFFSELAERVNEPGIVTGLAYTQVGGEILFIEATKMPGNGGLDLTGQLGEVMKESAQAALSYVRANARTLGIPDELFERNHFHIHVPAGAMPKDGPSAGVAMVTALASLAMNRRVKPMLAMTGEITLRGRVLPIGGVKEKVLAAKRAGVETVLLPQRNEKDLEDVPEYAKQGMDFRYMETISDVLSAALVEASEAPAAKS